VKVRRRFLLLFVCTAAGFWIHGRGLDSLAELIAIQPEDRSSRKLALSAMLGNEPAAGPFEYAGTNLIAVDDEGLLRVGRVALSIISTEDRRPYVRAITASYVADALMQFPGKLDICRWIVRTAPFEL
jgi:hypothetical protein